MAKKSWKDQQAAKENQSDKTRDRSNAKAQIQRARKAKGKRRDAERGDWS